ncbi:unnamed protein product [Euphydryas editha]|uniref:E3 ubiquitin-protein ligase listerin n=1 Tax=Euphydryas editha TaxID=104508 RepID=A0AAU9UEI0_EUPED|nr:unnamed protein product [Euphydryas editha]
MDGEANKRLTTRINLRALDEITESVKDGDVQDAVAVLSSWADHYQTLTTDSEVLVREAAQECHGALVRASGEIAAPALRRLLPAWLLACYDDDATVAELAHSQLQDAFPGSKFDETISLCKSEIIMLLIDNLRDKPGSMLSKIRESFGELLSKTINFKIETERILLSSLRALELFVTKLPETHDEWLWDKLINQLLHSQKFWNLVEHGSKHIRAHWYSVCGHIFEREGPRLHFSSLRVRFGRALILLSERGAVAVQRWAAVVQLMRRVEEWDMWFERKELLVKRLLGVLKNGAWGEAQSLSIIFPHFLFKLPTGLLTTDFYMALFNAIFIGLKHKNVLKSEMKREMWLDILQECLGFLSLQNPEYAIKIIPYVHKTWLEILVGIIDIEVKNISIEYSAKVMASLTEFWLLQTNKENGEKYDLLVRNFWLVIGSTISKQIDQLSVEADEITKLIETHILLLNTLEMSVSKDKTQRRTQSANQETVECGSAPCLIEHSEVTLMNRYHHNLIDVVENMCCRYFDFANTKRAFEAVFTALISFIIKFESDSLLMALARHFKEETIYDFYNDVLRHWLAGNTGCEPLVDIVFIVMKRLTEEERDRMFETFQQFPPVVVEWCLARTLAPQHRASGAAQRWLRGPVAESSVVALGSRDGDPDAMRLLLACLELNSHEEPLLRSAVKSLAVAQLRVECVAAATTTTLAASAPHWLQAVSVLAALFHYTLAHPCHDESPQYRAWQEARSSWSVVQFALPAALRALFVTHARELLHAHVFRDIEDLYVDRIANAASLFPHLFVAGENNITQSIAAEVSHIKQLFDMETENPEVPVEIYALRCDCIEGNINCPYEDENDVMQKVINESDKDYEELTKKDLVLFLYKSLFRAFVLRATLCDSDIEIHEILVTKSRNDDLLREEFIMEEFNKILYDATVLNVLCEKYAFWPDYDLILEGTKQINNAIDHMSSIMTPESKNILSSHFGKNAASRGHYWSCASRLFDQKNQSVMDTMSSGDVVTGIEYRSSDCHNEQAARSAARSTRRVEMLRSVLAAHARDRALCERIERASRAGRAPADIIISAHDEHEDFMLFKTDLSIAPWSSIVANAAIVEFLEEAVRTHGSELPAHQWDFTVDSLCSLVNSLRLSAHRWGCCKVAIIARAVLKLLGSVHEFVSTRYANCGHRPSAHVLALPVQWKDVIEPYLTQHLVELIMVVLEPEAGPMTSCRIQTIDALIASLPHLRRPALCGAVCARAAAALRCATHAARKYLAAAVLDFVTEALVLDDAEKLAAYCSRENVTPRPVFSLGYYNEAMMHLQDQVDAALSGVEVCEGTRQLRPGSAGHSAALGLLLLAARLLRQCARARGPLAQLYGELLSEGAFVGGLMASAVRLLPRDVLDGALDSAIHPVPTNYESSFQDVPPLDVYLDVISLVHSPGRCDADIVGGLACFVLCETLGGLAAGEALGWAGALSTSASTTIRRIVSPFVAPVLQRRLLRQLCESTHELPDDVGLSVEWSRVEVRCELQLEEYLFELTLQLADEHPLEPPTFTSSLWPAPETDSIALYLTYQNGTIVNAVKMWVDALTAHVQSSPQCFICYERVHSDSGRLPAVPCLQCRHKFHRFCLHKWFRTSRKKNCPLCRTKF